MENKSVDSLQNTFDIKKFLLKILAYWYLFIIAGGVSWFYASMKVKFSTPIYSVHATVLIESDARPTENILGGLTILNPTKNLKNEIGVFQSYEIIRRAINKLDFEISYYEITRFRDAELYNNQPFIVIQDTTHQQANYKKVYINIVNENEYEISINKNEAKKKLAFGDFFETNDFKFKLKLKQKYHDGLKKKTFFFQFNTFDGLVNSYKGRLQIQPQFTQGTILWLWSNGAVATKEANFLNTIANEYILMQLEKKNKATIKTIEFIDRQLASIMDSLDVAQKDLQHFRNINKITDITREGDALFTEIDKLYEEKNNVYSRLKYYEYYLKELDSAKDARLIAIPTVYNINDPTLYNLLTKFQTAYEKLDEMSLSVIQDIPSKKLLKNNIENLKKSLKLNISNNIHAAKNSIDRIEEELTKRYAQLHDLPILQREMRNITRKFELNDNIYTFLLRRRMEAGITQASNQAEAKILDLATGGNSVKVSPNEGDIQKKTLLIGLLLPLIFVILKDFLNNKIMDKSDIEAITNIPVVASIAHNDKKSPLPAHSTPNSPISESFRSLRTNLQYMMVDNDKKVISFTSTISGEGKSFCAANLAASLATAGKSTLIIGLDLRKPRLHNAFNLTNDIGISTMLIGESTFDEIILPTDIENLSITLSGPIPPNPAELIGTAKMLDFIYYTKEKFEYIILDTPPIAIVTDALLLSNFCDINIYVVRQNYTNKNALKVIDELYKNKNVAQLTILMNDVNFSSSFGYKYGYGQGYGYGYTYGYGTGQGYFDKGKKNVLVKIRDFLNI